MKSIHFLILTILSAQALYSVPSLINKKDNTASISIQGSFDDYQGGIAGSGMIIKFQKSGQCKIAITDCTIPHRFYSASYIAYSKKVKLKTSKEMKEKLDFLYQHDNVSTLIKVIDKRSTTYFCLAKDKGVSYLIPLKGLDINKELPSPKYLMRTSYKVAD